MVFRPYLPFLDLLFELPPKFTTSGQVCGTNSTQVLSYFSLFSLYSNTLVYKVWYGVCIFANHLISYLDRAG